MFQGHTFSQGAGSDISRIGLLRAGYKKINSKIIIGIKIDLKVIFPTLDGFISKNYAASISN